MEENEMFVTENEEIYEPEIIEEAAEVETKSLPTGLAMTIGGVLALAGFAGINKLRKVWRNHKAKKEMEVCDSIIFDDIDSEPDEL